MQINSFVERIASPTIKRMAERRRVDKFWSPVRLRSVCKQNKHCAWLIIMSYYFKSKNSIHITSMEINAPYWYATSHNAVGLSCTNYLYKYMTRVFFDIRGAYSIKGV